MKNFNWTTFRRSIAVKATQEKMYNAWTKAGEIEKWFVSKANYFKPNGESVDKNTSIVKGCTYEWNWYLYDVVERGKITEANGKDFLQFTFAGNCLVDINLSTQGDYVMVELTQKNIPTDDKSKKDIRLGCDSGWSFFLVNLKSVYENGYDLRNKDIKFKGTING